MNPESRDVPSLIVTEANSTYRQLVSCLTSGLDAASILLTEDSVLGKEYRGLLLGRASGEGATYYEFYVARLSHDVAADNVSISLMSKDGKEQSVFVTNASSISRDEIVELLSETTAILLVSYTRRECLSFCYDGKINRAVVVALYGIGKQQISSVVDLCITYEQKHALIQACLSSVNQNGKVTSAIASLAYSKVVLSNRKTMYADLGKAVQNFGIRLESLCQGGFLDVVSDICQPVGTAGRSAMDLSCYPKVRTVFVKSKLHSTLGFNVWIIDNALSEQFKKRWLKAIGILPFEKGRGGKKNAFIRTSCCTHIPAQIVIGGKFVYQGVSAGIEEMELIKIAQFVANYQRTIIEEQFGLYTVTFHCNLVHTVAASLADALYGRHSDYSALLCSSDDDYCHVVDEYWLPKRNEMQTATLVLSNSKEEYSTELIYTEEQDSGSTRPFILKRIPLGSCCLHIQGPGSQADGFRHEVRLLPGQQISGIYRCHSTFRFTLDPKLSKEEVDRRLKLDLGISSLAELRTQQRVEMKYDNVLSRCVQYMIEDSATRSAHSSCVDSSSQNSAIQLLADSVVDNVNRNSMEGGSLVINCGMTLVHPVDDHKTLQEETKHFAMKCDETLYLPVKSECDKHSDLQDLSVPFVCDLTSVYYTDLYRTKPPDLASVQEKFCSQLGYKVRLGGTMAEELSAYPMQRKLLDNGILLKLEVVLHGTGKSRIVPSLHQVPLYSAEQAMNLGLEYVPMSLPLPGTYFKVSSICSDAGLKHTDRSRPIYNYHTGTENVMILSRSYKNDAVSINTFLDRLDDWKREPADSPLFNETFTGLITVYGSGGAPRSIGEFAPTASNISKDDPQIVLPLFQETDKGINAAFQCMAKEMRVVTLYVNEAIFHDCVQNETLSSNPEFCRCLGAFACTQYTLTSLRENEVLGMHQGDSKATQKYSWFKMIPHVQVTFTPLMSNEHLARIKNNSNRPIRDLFAEVLIPRDCNHYIETYLPMGDKSFSHALGTDNNVLRSNALQSFIESGGLTPYMVSKCTSMNSTESFLQSENDHQPFITNNGATPKKRKVITRTGIQASISDVFAAAVLNNAAGALRFQGRSVGHDKGIVFGDYLQETCLPSVYRRHPMPMSNRALDVNCLFLRRDVISTVLFGQVENSKCTRIAFVPSLTGKLTDTLFKAMILRLTGRITPFQHYQDTMGKQSAIPTMEDMKDFLLFMESSLVKKDRTQKLTHWISEQHRSSLPVSVLCFPGFKDFAKESAIRINAICVQMLQTCQRKQATLIFCSMMDKLIEGENHKNNMFLAQQVIADVEEIFIDPFGAVNDSQLIAGAGAKQGHRMISNVTGRVSLADALRGIVHYVHHQATLGELLILGYSKNETDKCVRNLVNDRDFSGTDAEHFLCKAWIAAKYTLCNYRNSKLSRKTKPHCHPVRIIDLTTSSSSEDVPVLLDNIMEAIAEEYDKEKERLTIPNFCLLPGEIIHNVPWVEV